MRVLTHISLFSGIGGIDLAAEWAGFTTVLFCEIDPYCQAVLRKHWPGVPVIGDVRDVNKETVADAAGARRPTRASEGQPRRCGEGAHSGAIAFPAIDLLTGGFPCQPVSVAGKRCGKDDDRWLWPEMCRVVDELRPTWVLGENVAGLLSMGIDGVLSDLEGIGYEVQPFVIPACAVNAPHRRDRVFIVAHTNRDGESVVPINGGTRCGKLGQETTMDDSKGGRRRLRDTENIGATAGDVNASGNASAVCAREDVADTGEPGDGRGSRSGWRFGKHQEAQDISGRGRRSQDGIGGTEPRLGGTPHGLPEGLDGCWGDGWEEGTPRVAAGIPNRVNRLRCLGNAVVPAQVYPILRAIADIELPTTLHPSPAPHEQAQRAAQLCIPDAPLSAGLNED